MCVGWNGDGSVERVGRGGRGDAVVLCSPDSVGRGGRVVSVGLAVEECGGLVWSCLHSAFSLGQSHTLKSELYSSPSLHFIICGTPALQE